MGFMNLTECDLCKKNECGCATKVASYFLLLENAAKRVSTPNLTSSTDLKPDACIDKLTFELRTFLSAHELVARVKGLGITISSTRLRDRRYYYQIGSGSECIYVNHPFDPHHPITRVITRPSAFSSFGEYQNFLATIFTEEELNSFRVTRTDLAVNYPQEFEKLVEGLDCKNKRANVEYISKGAKRTGLMLGSGNERFVIYDHQVKHDGHSPKTRIECQLKGSKCPVRDYSEIGKLPERISFKNPFDAVQLKNINLKPDEWFETNAEKEKLKELSTLVRHEGFLAARKKLNTHKNFQRDYQRFFEAEPITQQPNLIIENYLTNYFHKEEKWKSQRKRSKQTNSMA